MYKVKTNMITSSRHSHKDFLKSQAVIRKRKKRMIRALTIRAVFLVVFIGIIVGIFWIPQLAISKVVVVGASDASGEKVKMVEDDIVQILGGTYFGIFPKKDFILYPKKEIMRSILKKYPEIGVVSMGTERLSTLNVRLTERAPAALWCQEGNCYVMDAGAFVYALEPRGGASSTSTPGASASNAINKNLLQIYGGASTTEELIGKQVITPELFSDILAVSAQLSSSSLPVENVTVAGSGQYIFKIEHNGRLLFSDKKPFKQSFEDLLSAYHSPVFSKSAAFQYIDVRFGNKVFYRLGTGTGSEESSTGSVASTTLVLPLSGTTFGASSYKASSTATSSTKSRE